jgi:hypothetical protein
MNNFTYIPDKCFTCFSDTVLIFFKLAVLKLLACCSNKGYL